MKLDNQSLLNEFFEKERHKFPQVSYDQFRDIVVGPWRHLKEVFESGTLEEVRIKYFGKFLVHKGKAKAELERVTKRFKDKTMPDKQYFKIKAMIEKFLNESEN